MCVYMCLSAYTEEGRKLGDDVCYSLLANIIVCKLNMLIALLINETF